MNTDGMMYNNDHRICLLKNTPIGELFLHVKKSIFYSILLRGTQPFTFWWDVVNSAFLQSALIAQSSKSVFATPADAFSLCHGRDDSSFALLDHHGPAAYQQDRDPSVQRFVPIDAWSIQVPGSVNDTAHACAVTSKRHPPDCQITRQPARSTFCFALQKAQPGFRYRFHCSCALRQTRECKSRIQSKEARPAFLSPHRLLRSTLSGILARLSETRQRRLINRHHGILKNLLGQSPLWYCHEQGTLPYGLRVLQPICRQIPRRYWLRLCHCSQRIFNHQSPCSRLPVQTSWPRLGDRRIPVSHSSEFRQMPSLRSHPQANPNRSSRSRTTDFIPRQDIRLPYLCDQSQDNALACISVLQPTRNYRKEQPRTSLRLPTRENTFRILDIQRRVLPNHSFRGQHRSLVQTSLFAAGILERNARYDSHRFFSIAIANGAQTQSQRYKIAARLPLSKRILSGVRAHQQIKVAPKISFLQNTSLMTSSTEAKK